MHTIKQPLQSIISAVMSLMIATCSFAGQNLTSTGAVSKTAPVAEKLTTPFKTTAEDGVFLSITDIHFDPFADAGIAKKLDSSPVSKWPQIFAQAGDKDAADYGSDASYPLASSAIAKAKAIGLKYDYILYSGDYLSHNFRATYNRIVSGDEQSFNEFVIKTVQYVSDLLSSEFNGIPVLAPSEITMPFVVIT